MSRLFATEIEPQPACVPWSYQEAGPMSILRTRLIAIRREFGAAEGE